LLLMDLKGNTTVALADTDTSNVNRNTEVLCDLIK